MTLNVAIIGCGRISGHHCRSLKKLSGFKIISVSDLIADKAKVYSEEFDIPYYTNYHEMFKKHPEINLVVIATPSGMHFEHAHEIIEKYKKNVIIEKPTFLKLSQLNKAYALAESNGVRIFPVFQNRYNKAVQRVLKAISTDELGSIRIASVRVRWCRTDSYYNLAPWRGTYAMDGGALTNQGVHHIDLLRYFAGEVKSVSAQMRTLGSKIEVEDTVTAQVTFESGAIGTIEITTAARPDNYEASLSVVCEKGLAQIGGIAVNELQIFSPDQSQCQTFSEDFSGNVYGRGHEQLYEDILNSFEKKKPFPVSKLDNEGTIALLQAIYVSAENQGKVVLVNQKQESNQLGKPDENLAKLYRTNALEKL